MIGSGLTEASLNAVTIGATCTHEDWRAPCFTTAEIALAKTQISEEQTAFDALSVEEQAAHTAAGGLAVRSDACDCRTCGSPTGNDFNSGHCGVASGTCSATVSGAGCYSSASSGCDCALLTTL
jgi:hypothetical protein